MEQYPESKLTEKIIGLAFESYNDIGPGLLEKVYQNTLKSKFILNKISYKEECCCKIVVDNIRVGSFRLDFLVEDKVVVELKVRDKIYPKDMAQTLTYMKTYDIKVGLILLFSYQGVKIKRLVI